jgi:L-asparaginase/Glu-tRNA(Gln) amidotransferase subunit D
MKSAILITHGTDTLAWTHAFVRYAIKNNNLNIAITGSQIPMPDLGDFSDAYINIGNSLRFLTNLTPPNIVTVFNYGANAFSDSLHKINRWDNNAFTGDLVARMEWEEIKFHDKTISISQQEKLEKLYLVTTGGTIESSFNEEGVLVPGKNVLMGFIAQRFSSFFKEISQQPVFAIDSSDLTFDRMKQIALKVEECIRDSGNYDAFADLNFSNNIKTIYTDPFKTTEQYIAEADGAEAVVIAGYGGGNITIDNYSENNIIPLIKELKTNNIPVVLTSQVALGPADFVYQNAWEAIKAGAISGVDLSIPEIQIRLSYLVGHKNQIKEAALSNNLEYSQLFESLFISGMKFRTQKSLNMYQKLKGFNAHPNDLLINFSFDESLRMIKESL